MSFTIEDTELPEVKIIRGKRFHDNRGFFSEIYHANSFKVLGLPEFVQDNLSESSKGVIRGMHWQDEPHGQGKLVQCISGKILDVAVDIRKDSANFGQHIAVELDEAEIKMLWIPVGFAHGYQALKNNSIVKYKVTNYWNQKSEKSLFFEDPKLLIKWRDLPRIISEKDLLAPKLNEI